MVRDADALPLAVPLGSVSELTFRRLQARDVVQADVEGKGEGHEFDLRLLVEATGLRYEELQELDGYDFKQATRRVELLRTRRPMNSEGQPAEISLSVDVTGAVLGLAIPFDIADGKRTEFHIRRIKARDLIKADVEQWGEGSYNFELRLLAEMTGIPAIQLGEMDAYDFNRGCGVTGGFIRGGPPTGAQLSGTSLKSSGSDEVTS